VVQLSCAFSIFDHEKGRPVLHRASRVEGFHLPQDFNISVHMEFSEGDEGSSTHVVEDIVSLGSHLKESPSVLGFSMMRREILMYDKGLWLATGNLGETRKNYIQA
jgi:hypothetical protein